MKSYRVNANELETYTYKLFAKAGLNYENAKSVANMLVHADLRGVSSHGVIRVPQYINKIRGGGSVVSGECPVIFETANTAVIDAGSVLGAVASEKAVAIAREKAKNNGMALVVVKNSNHFGMAAHWSLKLAGDDCIGYAGSNNNPSMPVPGGCEPFIGNNPFSFAVSAGEKYPQVCPDMATSMAAYGKALAYSMAGKPIPEGWMIDKDGNDTTDFSKYAMLAPMAGAKGFSCAFIVELFSSLLAGGTVPKVGSQLAPDVPELASHYFGCIRIDAFRDVKQFQKDLAAYIEAIHAQRVQSGVAKYPGQIEYENHLKALQDGIVLPETQIAQLVEMAEVTGLGKEEAAFLTRTEA